MKKRILLTPLFVLILLLYIFCLVAQALEDRHGKAGITCEGCHKENLPSKKVPTAVCLGCHGPYSKLAQETNKVEPNPHDSHEGEIDCDRCHHNHKPSENYCVGCHNFAFTVP